MGDEIKLPQLDSPVDEFGIPILTSVAGDAPFERVRSTRLYWPVDENGIPIIAVLNGTPEIVDRVRSTRLHWPINENGVPIVWGAGDETESPNEIEKIAYTAGTLIVEKDVEILEGRVHKFDSIVIHASGRLTINGVVFYKNLIKQGVLVNNGGFCRFR